MHCVECRLIRTRQDRASPTRSPGTTRRAAHRTMQTLMQRHDLGRRRGTDHGQHPRPESTSTGGGTGRAGRTTPRRARPLSLSRCGSGRRSTYGRGARRGPSRCASRNRDPLRLPSRLGRDSRPGTLPSGRLGRCCGLAALARVVVTVDCERPANPR